MISVIWDSEAVVMSPFFSHIEAVRMVFSPGINLY